MATIFCFNIVEEPAVESEWLSIRPKIFGKQSAPGSLTGSSTVFMSENIAGKSTLSTGQNKLQSSY